MWLPGRRARLELDALRSEREGDLALIGSLARQVDVQRDLVDRLVELWDLLLEPTRTPHCVKVRISTRAEAQQFAVRLQHLDPDHAPLEPYRCPVCLRNPVTTNRYWHVRHSTKANSGKAGYRKRAAARARERALGADGLTHRMIIPGTAWGTT